MLSARFGTQACSWCEPRCIAGGAADISGSICSEKERRAICVIAENTPGVKQVIDHLVVVETYTGTVIGDRGL